MRKSTKAILYSAFILPGAGHILLKRYITAICLIGAASIALYVILTNAVERTFQITDKILSGEVAPDVAVIADLLSQQQQGNSAQLIEFATTALITAWFIGIVDSWRVGRYLNKQGK